ncbi:ribosome small subunit-dependent GTPase A [Saccharospirillum mangrovi]|uniref:ribosome small subunit-dependent GTPase A n=1 Tax=Saccharospirillum mangrovi TaxID=2161747 RepID=UPI0018E54A7A|nr:ribosome small subunit-dependent GTPase A [Saccharospirillum mangrovi]
MTSMNYSLAELGWRPVFLQQLTLDELETGRAARVTAVHRDRLEWLDETGAHNWLISGPWRHAEAEDRPTLGDWLWLDAAGEPQRLLERQTLLRRTASGTEPKPQLIAANLDTLLIVASCNADFNLSRLERYLALALDAGVDPVIVLTKADLADDMEAFRDQAQTLRAGLPVVCLDARQDWATDALAPWLTPGQSLALVGSSGVGKTTLTNSLIGEQRFFTAAIREDDAKGRHTTTQRQMVRTQAGAWIMDTPGMRELRLGDSISGVSAVFDDIETLAQQCRFGDCSHQGDAGCAVAAAIESGELDARRLRSYQKLQREAVHASETAWQKRRRYRAFGKLVKQSQKIRSSD